MPFLPSTPEPSGPAAAAATPASVVARGLRVIAQALPLIGLALLPKCPMCLVMYLGFLTAVGVDAAVAAQWTEIGLIAAGGLILIRLWRTGLSDRTPFWLGLTGLAGISAAYYTEADLALRWSALALIFAGCVLHARRQRAHLPSHPTDGATSPSAERRPPAA